MFVLRAETGAHPIWDEQNRSVPPDSLPLSPRLLVAIADWVAFWEEVGGAINDADILDEFVSQGFKIAHGMRRELKGTTIYFEHPTTGERTEILLRGR